MKHKRRTTNTPVRFQANAHVGLTKEQVAVREREGWTNYMKNSNTKPVYRIFLDNLLTYFNLVWGILAFIVIFLGEYAQLTFMVVVVANTALAIIMELRAKFTLEKLNLVSAPTVAVIRDGQKIKINADDLVLDDIILLSSGDQVPADCVMISGIADLNESMLTGESDAIKKTKGGTLLAGSYLISGSACARVDRVGEDSYIQSIAKRVKKFRAPQSYLFRDINRIIKWIGIFIIPFSFVMFLNNYNRGNDLHAALLTTAGSVQGMIPAGMFLLITVAFSLGVVKLAKKRARVADTYSIEMLARTDMLCLDKTGTITDGTMRVVKDEQLGTLGDIDNTLLLSSLLAAQSDTNFTSTALNLYYKAETPLPPLFNVPFSSKRKYTATVFGDVGTVALGAPEFILSTLPDEIKEKTDAYAREGQRVLLLAGSPTATNSEKLPPDMFPLSLIVLEDHIRNDAPDTLAWFTNNDVAIKIISGDNPITVSAIAKRVGVPHAEDFISLEGLSDEEVAAAADRYTVFGRVTPEQKLTLVLQLRKLGHVVSMTGDGVNDAMALKEADCSIAMASGSDVARGLSSIVLLDNNFSVLPDVVKEGRQVVNNVQRSSSLFLMKTFFAITFSLFCIAIWTPYPFEPNSLFMFETFVTGFPSVLLALQRNHAPIEGRFISKVLKQCIPDGMMILISVAAALIVTQLFAFPVAEQMALLILVLTLTAFINLLFLCFPPNGWRLLCILLAAGGIVGTIALSLILPDQIQIFAYTAGITPRVLLWLVFFLAASTPVHLAMNLLYTFVVKRNKARLDKKKAA